jgi:hypothetical protein
MKKGCSWIFDLITAIFLLLSIGVITLVVILVANPRSPLNPLPPPTPIAQLIMPTDLPTWTPTNTFTPEPATRTPTATDTPIPTSTSTATPIPPTLTPSNTPVLGVRASPTRPGSRPNQSPTAPPAPPTNTPSGFQFVARPVQYDANKTTEGCKWSSIAGAVIDAAGNPVRGIAISVQGGGGTIDETQYSGQERRFGEGGFEVFLGSQPRADDYTLTVLGRTGAPLSEPVQVRTRTTCTENVLIVTFVQTR